MRKSEKEFNAEEYRGLLNKAVSSVTQKEFAEKAGISRSVLNKALTGADTRKPNRSTLLRFTAPLYYFDSPVKINDLMDACGYERVTDAEVCKSMDACIEKWYQHLVSDAFSASDGTFIPQLSDDMKHFIPLASDIRITYMPMAQPGRHKVFSGLAGLDDCFAMTAVIMYRSETLFIDYPAVIFFRKKNHTCTVAAVRNDDQTLRYSGEQFRTMLGMDGWNRDRHCRDWNCFASHMKPAPDDIRSFLGAIFGYGSNDDVYMTAVQGFGFSIKGRYDMEPSDRIAISSRIEEILMLHQDILLRLDDDNPDVIGMYHSMIDGEDLFDAFSTYKDHETGCRGVGAAIAAIMRCLTGEAFGYYAGSVYDDHGNRIMEPNETIMLIPEDGRVSGKANLFCASFAHLLGIPRYGFVIHRSQHHAGHLYETPCEPGWNGKPVPVAGNSKA